MYIRTVRRKNKNGSVVEYLQLAHNRWNKDVGHGVPKILLNLGRKENIDVRALRRLGVSLQKIIERLEEDEATVQAEATQAGAKVAKSKKPASSKYPRPPKPPKKKPQL